MKDFEWTDTLWAVVKADGKFAGSPCLTHEEAFDLSAQHEGSHIFCMDEKFVQQVWENVPPKNKDKHYLFEVMDEECEIDGEMFLVEAPDLYKAWEIAKYNFENINLDFKDVLTDAEADATGLDEF